MKFTKKQLDEFRRDLEIDIVELLDETESDFTLDDVKDTIFNEEESDDFQKVIMMFDDGNLDQDVLDLVSDAWNHFPHKALGGKAPVEILQEHENKRETK